MSRIYGDGTNSSIGATQFNDFYWQKKALIEAKKSQYFSQLCDVTQQPKHFGKKIKRYHYLPLLDDANINDQGIDATGSKTAQFKTTIKVTNSNIDVNLDGSRNLYFIGEGNSSAAAILAAKNKVSTWAKRATKFGGAGVTVTGAGAAGYTFLSNATDGTAYALGYRFSDDTVAVPFGGNLYGSSKDVGTIASKLPALTENGGRVNRVGFKRVELEGTFKKFGFFDEYTQESIDFDSDAELMEHVNREMVIGANEMTEDAIQIDLLNAAGVVRFGGTAVSTATITGANGATASQVTYNDLMRLSLDLDNNRCPKNTKIVTGTRLVDTKTIQGARYMYIGTELVPMIKTMVDSFNQPAFTSVEKYAAGTTLAEGEIGSVEQFRIIVVPEMMHWEGAGAAVGTDGGYRNNGTKYNVYPMLVIGSGSFTTIGFQSDGKSHKFKIKHVKPGSDISYSKDDPYGEKGFMSIKWYYGSLVLRPERIALVKCVAEW